MKKVNTKKLKKERGITLVALVVTIVVLLILAGVSINMVLGNNGLITKAKDAKEQTESSTVKDEVSMMIGEWQIEKYVYDTGLEDYLNSKLILTSDEREQLSTTIEDLAEQYP